MFALVTIRCCRRRRRRRSCRRRRRRRHHWGSTFPLRFHVRFAASILATRSRCARSIASISRDIIANQPPTSPLVSELMFREADADDLAACIERYTIVVNPEICERIAVDYAEIGRVAGAQSITATSDSIPFCVCRCPAQAGRHRRRKDRIARRQQMGTSLAQK